MRLITVISALLICAGCSSAYRVVEQPTPYSTVIEKGRITAVIFDETGDCFMCLQNEERFTPTLEDIATAERILSENIKSANSAGMNQVDNCPVIHENLKSYRRQFFGYYSDQTGNKIIYATFNWDRHSLTDRILGYNKSDNENWKKEKQMVMDGCSYHWSIKINLDTEELFELGVNGIAQNEKMHTTTNILYSACPAGHAPYS